MFMVEGMKPKETAALKAQIEKMEHVEKVIWYDSVMDISVPMELMPDELYEAFNSGDCTLMIIIFNETTSADSTMEAIEEIRRTADKNCFLSGMSAVVTDTKNLSEKEAPVYVFIAVLLTCIVLSLAMDSYLVSFIFLVSIGMAVIYNLGSNIIFGEISYITKALSAVLQLGVTMDYSIFLWHSYQEQQKSHEDKKGSHGGGNRGNPFFRGWQLHYYGGRIYRLMLYEFYAWYGSWPGNGKGSCVRRGGLCNYPAVADSGAG